MLFQKNNIFFGNISVISRIFKIFVLFFYKKKEILAFFRLPYGKQIS